jgi:hypothetical protein
MSRGCSGGFSSVHCRFRAAGDGPELGRAGNSVIIDKRVDDDVACVGGDVATGVGSRYTTGDWGANWGQQGGVGGGIGRR